MSNFGGDVQLSPLVLLHGGSWSGDQWRDIAPLLSAHHDVYTPSALGHHGGPVVQRRPVTIWDVIDQSERHLDERGLDRPHLAGHSMGGFTALELARRGRAASVCAFSPGGLWSDDLRAQVAKGVRRQLALSRLMRPLTTLLMKSPGMRRRALTDATLHGDRLSYRRAIELTEQSLECTIIDDIFNNTDEQVAPMDPLPCPITIAWAENDRILPVEVCEAIARDRLPARHSPSCPASRTLRRLTLPSWSPAPSSPSPVPQRRSHPPISWRVPLRRATHHPSNYHRLLMPLTARCGRLRPESWWR